MTSKPTEQHPNETKMTGLTTNEWVLEKRFLQSKSCRQPGRQEFLQLWTYAPIKNGYRSWFFNSQGHAAEWSDQWDEGSKTFSGKSGTGSVRKGHFIDKDTIEWTLVAKDKDGKVFLDLEAKQTRRKAPVDQPYEKTGQITPKSSEFKVLERWVGKWDSETTARAAVWTPKEFKVTGDKSEWAWILDGKFLYNRGINRDVVIQVMTFDPRRKAYRFWNFSTDGNASESSGQWDEDSKTLALKADLGTGITMESKVKWLDRDSAEWTAVAKDKDAKVYLNMEGKITRQK